MIHYKKQKLGGFTLVEALIAMSILIVGVISGFVLVIKALYNVTIIQDRLTASFLAQEGVELVRQLRDTNFLKRLNGENVLWTDGILSTCGGEGCLIWADVSNNTVETSVYDPASPPPLYYHSDTGLYNYDSSDSLTSFKRVIQITPVSPNELKVEVKMTWESRGMDFSFTLEDHLFNWLPV